jgi:hypothetical protein
MGMLEPRGVDHELIATRTFAGHYRCGRGSEPRAVPSASDVGFEARAVLPHCRDARGRFVGDRKNRCTPL